MKKIRKYNKDDYPTLVGIWERYLQTRSIFIMKVLFLILVMVPALGLANTPQKVEKNLDVPEYHIIYNDSLDLKKVDYSDVFEKQMTPLLPQEAEDCTHLFIADSLRLIPDFFATYNHWEDKTYEAPANGILGDDFKRIEIYFYPNSVRIDSLTYFVKGRSKVKNKVCDFSGEIKIKNIYHLLESEVDSIENYCIIADYLLREDDAQGDCGIYSGIFGAYGYTSNVHPDIININDLEDDADGYMNRTFVGILQNCKKTEHITRCIWGDYRLPFSFDFDIGDGELIVNPKYSSPDWDRYMQGLDIEIVDTGNGNSRALYRNPWW